MKSKILRLTAIVLFITQSASSQISLEKTFPSNENSSHFENVNLTLSGKKLQRIDYEKGEIIIYNDDYTVFKTLTFEPRFDATITVGYVSDKLFNLDDKIEFMVEYDGGRGELGKSFVRIYSENGLIIFQKNGFFSNYNRLKYIEPIKSVGDSYKLFINTFGYESVEIYSLPGDLPLSVSELEIDKTKYDIKLFPNPASENKFSIAYTLPENVKLTKVNIYNTLGQVVKTVKPNNSSSTLDIDTQNLQKGTYFCELIGNKGKISASQFIVQ